MRVLLSAYSCAPNAGSEPGAGYSILRAASQVAECWVLTRMNNVSDIKLALGADPTPNPVHVVGLDLSERSLRWKRRTGFVRGYYYLWQRAAARRAAELESSVGAFDIVHHATMSAFWMPVGVATLHRPLILGPLSGGTLTPRDLRRFLGWRRRVFDFFRTANVVASGFLRRSLFDKADVIIAQNEQMKKLIERRAATRTPGSLLTHSHASDPTIRMVVSPSVRQPIALFVGRLVSWKGPLLAVESFREVGIPEARLVLVGEGPDRDLIERRIRRLEMTHRVELRGAMPRDEVLALMAEASCLVFPSFHDSAGFVVSEALTLGTPVVCLDHGGPGAIVRLWPGIPSAAIRPGRRRETVKALGQAIEERLKEPPPRYSIELGAAVTLADVIRTVYERFGHGRIS